MNNTGKKNVPYVTIALMAINIIYFLFLEIIGSTENSKFMLDHGAAFGPYILDNKEYYRLFTAMFMHFGIDHIVNNMLVLFIIGDNLERALGKVKYLIFYIICGVGANVVSLFYYEYTDQLIVSAGASGAIFGIIGGLLYAVVINKGQLENLSQRQLMVIIGLSIYHGFTNTGIDNAAHLGGLAIGILMGIILYRKPKPKDNIWGELL